MSLVGAQDYMGAFARPTVATAMTPAATFGDVVVLGASTTTTTTSSTTQPPLPPSSPTSTPHTRALQRLREGGGGGGHSSGHNCGSGGDGHLHGHQLQQQQFKATFRKIARWMPTFWYCFLTLLHFLGHFGAFPCNVSLYHNTHNTHITTRTTTYRS